MDRREQILDVAEQATRTAGYNGFSYADLAEAVGIRKASIHHHFRTKPDLALAVMERYGERFFAALGRIEQDSATAGEQLAAYLAVYRNALSGGRSLCLCVALSAERDSQSDPVLRELERFHATSLEWLAALFERASKDGTVSSVGEPEEEAAACLALVEGGQLIARAAAAIAPFDHAVRSITKRIVSGP